MDGVCQAVCWVPNKIATLSDRAETVKNMLSVITAGIRFIQGIPNELPKIVNVFQAAAPVQQVADRIISAVKPILPTLAPVFNTLDIAKDYLTFLEFSYYLRDAQNPEKWYTYNGVEKVLDKGKAGELGCKLGFSGLESIFLIPDKFKWIDLAAWIGKSATVCLKLGSLTLVLGASAFSIWNANKSIDKAKNDQVNDKERNLSLKQIHDGQDAQIGALMRDYLGISDLTTRDQKTQGKTKKLEKTYEKILMLRREIHDLEQAYQNLKGNANSNAEQITAVSDKLEAARTEMKNAQQKAKRCVYFYREATGVDLSVIAQNKNIISFIQANLAKFQDPQRAALQNLTLSDPEDPNNNFILGVQNIIALNPIAQENALLNNLLINTNFLRQVTPLPHINRNLVEHIVDYKIKKNCRDIDLKESQEARGNRKIEYEITKIAIIASVILFTLITHAFLPAIFVTATAAVGFSMWVSGFAICLTGLRRTIFEAFYYKDPNKSRLPTTMLV